jgi:lysophospholipase L1-like esterase
MRRLLFFSLFLNSILAGTIGYVSLRMGGLKQAFSQYWYAETGIYTHRKEHFNALDTLRAPVVFLGDSHIEQCEWSELLGRYNLPGKVINRGITGDQTEGVRQRVSEVIRHRPSKVFICVGVHDLLLNKDFRSIERSYRDLVRQLRTENRSGQVILISVPPINNSIKQVGLKYEDITELNNRIQQIARDNAIPYVNLHAMLADQNGLLAPRFSTDGLHLNAAGYNRWRSAIEVYLK